VKAIVQIKLWLAIALVGVVIGFAGALLIARPQGYHLVLLATSAALLGGFLCQLRSKANVAAEKVLPPVKPQAAGQTRKPSLPVQIPPLFLFNTLHNISALAMVDPAKASLTIEKLAELIRTTTEMGRQKITLLAQELKCADLYLNIEKARFGSRLEIITDVDPECLEAKVPSLLLLPIVDNAVRYGVEPNDQITQVILIGRKAGDCIVVEISDTGKGINAEQAKTFMQSAGSLSSLSKRLHDVFAEAAQMRIEPLAPSGTRVKITVPKRNDLEKVLEGDGKHLHQ